MQERLLMLTSDHAQHTRPGPESSDVSSEELNIQRRTNSHVLVRADTLDHFRDKRTEARISPCGLQIQEQTSGRLTHCLHQQLSSAV